jgi:hypothetical protein
MKTASLPESALIIGDDAYLLETTEITWYRRDPAGQWGVVIASVSMCWGQRATTAAICGFF